jgi:hypothetical protein
MSGAKPLPVVLLDWRPFPKGSLLGFAKVSVGALEITDVTVHLSGGRKWAGLPAKPQIDREGNVRRDAVGKIQYAKVIAWTNKETGDRFSESVVAAIEERYGSLG